MIKEKKTEMFLLKLTPFEKRGLQIIAITENKSMSEIIMEALEDKYYLKKIGKNYRYGKNYGRKNTNIYHNDN